MDGVIVIKIGGTIVVSGDTTIEDIVTLQQNGKSLVVVHGGGNLVTEWVTRLGINTRFVHGERVTDKAMLEVVIAVLGGLVNKEIVAAINSCGGRAVGISGVDGAMIQGRIKSQELGYVAEVVGVNVELLKALLQNGYVPVVSPLSLHFSDRTGEVPLVLNINSDPLAGEIAAALGAEKLVFLTDVEGVHDQSGRLLPRISSDEAEALIDSGVASGGMVPKIRACLRARSVKSAACIVNGRGPHALLKEIEEGGSGTKII